MLWRAVRAFEWAVKQNGVKERLNLKRTLKSKDKI